LCSGTRNTQPRSPVESSDAEDEIPPHRIRMQNERQPPLSPTESRLRALHKANTNRMKNNSNHQGKTDKPMSVFAASSLPPQHNHRAMSAPAMPYSKRSEASDEEILNRKAAMKRQIKEVLKPYLFLNELCRLDRELDTLCDGLLANAFSSSHPSNQMDDVKSYVEESSSILSGNRESCNIDFERSTPAVSEKQDVTLISNEYLGEGIRRSLAFTNKIDGLKKKSQKIIAEITRLEKQNADAILSPECNYSIMRSREHEIASLKRRQNIVWEQISNSISLMKAEHSREAHGGATTNRTFSSSTPPARQICLSSVDLTNEEEKSRVKHAGFLTHEPKQSSAILQSNDSQGTDSVVSIQDIRNISLGSRTNGTITRDGEQQSKCTIEVSLSDINTELVEMP